MTVARAIYSLAGLCACVLAVLFFKCDAMRAMRSRYIQRAVSKLYVPHASLLAGASIMLEIRVNMTSSTSLVSVNDQTCFILLVMTNTPAPIAVSPHAPLQFAMDASMLARGLGC